MVRELSDKIAHVNAHGDGEQLLLLLFYYLYFEYMILVRRS